MGGSTLRGAIVALAIGLAPAWSGGCGDEGADPTALCDHVCSCQTPFPALKDQCVVSCESDLEPGSIPDACGACIESLTCGELLGRSDQCADECLGDAARDLVPGLGSP